MSVALQTTPTREIDLSNNQIALIKRTLAADCNDDEFNLYIEVARRMKADPFRRHLYALVFSKNDKEKRRMSIVTGIDFYRVIAQRNRDYRPDDQAPTFVCKSELESPANPLGIEYCEVRAFKLGPDNKWYPSVGIAYWNEYVPLEEKCEEGWRWIETGEVWEDSGKPKKKRVPNGVAIEVPKGKWLTMPRVMIAKCAEAQALRKGWPEDMAGVYVEEEMDRSRAEEMSASEMAEAAAVEKRLALTSAGQSIMVLWAPGEALEAVPLGKFADRAMAFIKVTAPEDVRAWQEFNRAPLREFWARQKSDALAIAKAADDRIKGAAA
jgi:phage recombination protein Bet